MMDNSTNEKPLAPAYADIGIRMGEITMRIQSELRLLRMFTDKTCPSEKLKKDMRDIEEKFNKYLKDCREMADTLVEGLAKKVKEELSER